MATGKRREAWDMTAALQITIMNCGFAKVKKMPKIDALNPIRAKEAEDDGYDEFDTAMNSFMQKMSR